MTHLANADAESGGDANAPASLDASLAAFAVATAEGAAAAIDRSATAPRTLRYGRLARSPAQATWVRPGIMLYGFFAQSTRSTVPPSGSCNRP